MDETQKEYVRRLIVTRASPCQITGCWIWCGSVTTKGYGDFRAFKRHFLAHRASYEAFNGQIPDGLHVLHSCDVRQCCNPAHLSIGTNNDNIADSMRKGRRRGITRNRPSGLKYKPMSEIGRYNHTKEGRALRAKPC